MPKLTKPKTIVKGTPEYHVSAIESDPAKHELEMIRTADSWSVVNPRLPRKDGNGYRTDVKDLTEAEMVCAKIFAKSPGIHALLLYAIRGPRNSHIANVYPPEAVPPPLPKSVAASARQWVVGGQGWNR